MTTVTPATARVETFDAEQARRLSEGLVAFLETNTPPEGLFHPDVFGDLSLPQWRLQTASAEALVHLRRHDHPDRGRVSRWRSDPTPGGFVFEFEERWTDARGGSWYAREMIRATVTDGRISELSIYCTGDWDQTRQGEHARTVKLLRR
jgi:hypothetical protein